MNAHAHRVLNVLPSKPDPRDWTHEAAGPLVAVASLPKKVDLRRPDWPVGDQGSTGSCVGWGTADGMARFMMNAAGLSPITTKLSPRFVWEASKEMDPDRYQPTAFIDEAGTYVKTAVQVLKKWGVVPESMLPFSGGIYKGSQQQFYETAARLKVKGYYYLSPGGPAAMKQWLATHGPFIAAVNVDSKWDNVGKDGWIRGHLDIPSIRGGHLICSDAYEDQPDGTTAFGVRNSWGPSWGDRGFAWCDAQYVSDSFTECYGIVV